MLHSREMEVLNILFSEDKPLTVQEIVRKADIPQSTIHSILRNMIEQGLVEVDSVVQVGNVYGRKYIPKEKAKQEVMNQLIKQYSAVKDILPVQQLADALLDKV